ncbi:MAG: dienelactone hydrolase family protein [Rhabdochlamydiaceae bacterium]|nr:dienelactone hydrolase family protein [Rhabdochlamydiaceae bacterium]
MQTLKLPSGLEIGYLGPDLSAGPLPAVFYFALSAEESLDKDPFNQPAVYLSKLPMRIFSLTLPGHGPDLPATQAMFLWAQALSCNHNIIKECIDQIEAVVETLIHLDLVIAEKIGVMGLSRGAFIAFHAAARIPLLRHIVGFAPLTKLSSIKEFQSLTHNTLVQSLDLTRLIESLADRTILCTIGNLDTRVGTRHCFDFIEELAQAALEKKIRSPQIEMIITPSIGFQGHGTSKEIFHQGAHFLAHLLGAIDVL